MKKWAFIYLLRFLALLGFFSAASVYAATGYYNIYEGNSKIYSTPLQACQAAVPLAIAEQSPRTAGSIWYDYRCNYNYTLTQSCCGGVPAGTTGTSYLDIYTITYNPTPTPTASPSPTPQACPTSFGPSGAVATGYCISDNKDPPRCLKFKGNSYEQWVNSLPTSTCVDSCEYSILPHDESDGYVFRPAQPLVNGWTQVGYTYETKGTGSICNSPPFDPNQPPPNLPPLPPQSCGEVNGQSVCFDQKPPIGTDGIDTKEQTNTNSDGSKTETKTETTCVGNTCETTKTDTTKDPSGNSTGSSTTTTTENKESYCSKNPQSTQCKGDDFCKTNADLSICKEGKWSETSCDSVPACGGDAVQCAQAANAFKTYCESKKTADALYGTGQGLDEAQSAVDSAMSFGSGSGSLLGDSGTVGIGSFDQSNPWGASCLADTQVAEFEGKAITIPFSKYCSVFELMGRIAVAATLLAAGLFVFRD